MIITYSPLINCTDCSSAGKCPLFCPSEGYQGSGRPPFSNIKTSILTLYWTKKTLYILNKPGKCFQWWVEQQRDACLVTCLSITRSLRDLWQTRQIPSSSSLVCPSCLYYYNNSMKILRSDPPADYGCWWEESDSHYQHMAQFGERLFVCKEKSKSSIQSVALMWSCCSNGKDLNCWKNGLFLLYF